ncbi:MAG: ABC transporter permease [Prevotellaceae bacterium]|jgi:putative ABC transport system permease protein|nr:ABC transporter permease [Prevotellaceae bacterium]
MNKKLFTQLKNEWRSNTWLAVELLLVSVVMWYVTDYLYAVTATRLEPLGFDISHCYRIGMGELTDKSPDFIAGRTAEETEADVLEFLARLQRRPEVEAASLSQASHPYNYSNSTDPLRCDTLSSPRWTLRRLATPDFVRVFRYHGAKGETPEQLAAMLEKGEFLASGNLFQDYGKPLTDFIGKRFTLFGDTTRSYPLGAALAPVRYDEDTQTRYSVSFLAKMWWANPQMELCVRVKADQDHDFIDRLKADSEKQLRIGNIYLAEVRSFADIRRNYAQAEINEMRNYLTGMGFLLLNIFLGLLGTFWFRTAQRRSEIALHKVFGATDRVVFVRLLSEGLWVLLLVTLPALAIDYALAEAELNQWYDGTTLSVGRVLACAAVSFGLIAVMMVIGISIPARKAMRTAPAEALHDE